VSLFNSIDEVFLSYIGNWRKIKKSSYNQADQQDLWKCRECSFRLMINKDLKNDNRLEAKIQPTGAIHAWSDSRHTEAFMMN
jgi:hypothetical protein